MRLNDSPILSALPTPAEMHAARCGQPLSKGLPTPLAKVEKQKAKKLRAEDFRKGVWARDQSRSRASGKRVARSGTDFEKVGEVHHVIPRSLAPERVYDIANGLLLSKHEHHLAETACPNDPAHCLLDIEGPDNRREPQTFIWRDVHGKELRRRTA